MRSPRSQLFSNSTINSPKTSSSQVAKTAGGLDLTGPRTMAAARTAWISIVIRHII